MWDPPAHSNGRIQGYNIRYWRYGQSESQAVNTPVPSSSAYTASGLTPATDYVFCVKAQTSIGWGTETCADVITSNSRGRRFFVHTEDSDYDFAAKLPLTPKPEKNPSKEESAQALWLRWPAGREPGKSPLTSEEAPPRSLEVQYQKANEDGWTHFEQLVLPSQNNVQLTR